ncbi:MAG TPA: acetyl-coenzyme A synthetase, partial [Algoriphagus sp.]|uniref:AMP-binding protein n=1 Tax=Algoriphagus sp. TaxID=1872435 RepID=UPI000EDDD37B
MSDRLHTLSGYLYEYQKSVAQPEEFWSRVADSFHWKKRWSKTLKWNFRDPDVKWFINGKLNITENIFERHLYTIGDRPAIIWEPNDPKEAGRTLTYKELYHAVCQFSNALKAKGIGKGDRVIIYMPMVPEAAVAMLACARIGAIHSVVFAGFSASALADRVNDCQAKAILTADGNFRGNKKIPVKDVVDEALEKSSVETVIVYQRTHQEINMKSGRDHWWHDVIKEEKEENKAEEMDSEDMLFILYTSGSTGKPKGVVHTTGGYMVYTKYSFENVFQYSPGDIYWCTADIVWITGHS